MAPPSLTVAESGEGHILVTDTEAGHRFAFRLASGRGGAQLDAMAPEWAGGTEPASSQRLTIEARQVAEREARDNGWLDDTTAPVDDTP